jgi:hypothetical protein
MNPQHLSGEGSLAQESKKTVGENLRLAYEVARIAVAKNRVWEGCSLPISKEIERRRWSYHAEDPIRTMMFLGSWSHTWENETKNYEKMSTIGMNDGYVGDICEKKLICINHEI